jgi:hypothetical protein
VLVLTRRVGEKIVISNNILILVRVVANELFYQGPASLCAESLLPIMGNRLRGTRRSPDNRQRNPGN